MLFQDLVDGCQQGALSLPQFPGGRYLAFVMRLLHVRPDLGVGQLVPAAVRHFAPIDPIDLQVSRLVLRM